MSTTLFVGNRNYSSWSLRPWLALTWAGVEFQTEVIPLGGPGYGAHEVAEVLAVSPSGTVPALRWHGETIVDSLAICEWAAEAFPALWPEDRVARAHARAAACEMHSSFGALRSALWCNIRRRTEPRQLSADVQRDVRRIESIWTTLRERFGGSGPYLFGDQPTIADAFFTPVATRFRTYGVAIAPAAQHYASALLSNPAFVEWESAAIAEPWTIAQAEAI